MLLLLRSPKSQIHCLALVVLPMNLSVGNRDESIEKSDFMLWLMTDNSKTESQPVKADSVSRSDSGKGYFLFR